MVDVQLQQHPVRVAVAKPLLALLLEVVLEGADSLWVVPLQTIDDLVDVLRPLLGVLGVAHGGQRYVGRCWEVRTRDV